MRRAPALSDLAKGAAAGAAGTWAMDRVTTWLYEHESPDARAREHAARGGQSAYAIAAERLAHAAGLEITEAQKARAATAIHWATGIIAGMKYAVFRRYRPEITRDHGVSYGVGFFLVVDELMSPALGLTPGPAAFPWQAHARGLAGHVALGTVADTTLRALDRLEAAARRPRSETGTPSAAVSAA